MSILSDAIILYLDGNGFVAPRLADASQQRGSDNGPLYSSEWSLVRIDLLDFTNDDAGDYLRLINTAVNSDGYLTRAPGDTTTGNPDNHVGVYAALVAAGLKPTFKFPLALLRQPQLLLAHQCAKGVVKWYKPWYLPLKLYTALILDISGIGASGSDPWILSYLLGRATGPSSWLCRVGMGIFKRRLMKVYPGGMKDVYKAYFEAGHPIATYSKEF